MAGVAEADERMPFLKKALSLAHQLRPTLSFDPNTGSPSISVDTRAANSPDSLGAVMGMIRKISGTTSTGALRTAIKRLVGKRLIYSLGGKYRFANPFFKAWLLQRM